MSAVVMGEQGEAGASSQPQTDIFVQTVVLEEAHLHVDPSDPPGRVP